MLGILPGLVGIIQATEVIKLILGIGEPLVGRLLLVDALGMSFRTLKLRKNPECPVCGAHPTVTALIDYDQFCGIEKPVDATTPLERPQDVKTAPDVDGIPQISVRELKARQVSGDMPFVLDVRDPHEYAIVNLGVPQIPLGSLEQRLGEIPVAKTAEIITHCKTGGRSQKAALLLKQHGYTNVKNLAGGITAWATEIDPNVPKY